MLEELKFCGHYELYILFQTEISQINTRVDDVLGKMKTLKDQIKQMSEDQNQMIDILRSMAEKQVG